MEYTVHNEALIYMERYYYIYKYKSYSKAAMYYRPDYDRSNMRLAVKKLEDIYHKPLVIVQGKRILFTKYGNILGIKATRIFEEITNVKNLFERISNEELSIVAPYDFFKYYLNGVLKLFITKNNPGKIIKTISDYKNAIEYVKKGKRDVAIVPLPDTRYDELTYEVVAEAKIIILAKKEIINKLITADDLKILNKYKGAMNDESDLIYDKVKTFCIKHGIALNITENYTLFEELKESLINDRVDYIMVGNYPFNENLFVYDLTPLIGSIEIAIVYRKGEKFSIPLKELLLSRELSDVKPKEIKN